MINIREAELADIENLLDLWDSLMRYHQEMDKEAFSFKKNARTIMKSFFVKNIKSKDSIVLLAEDNNKPVAYLMGFIQKQPRIFVDDRYGFLSDAFVVEDYRSKGIMKEMIGKAEAFFRSRDLKTLSGRVFIGNKKALEIWKKTGFREGSINLFRDIR